MRSDPIFFLPVGLPGAGQREFEEIVFRCTDAEIITSRDIRKVLNMDFSPSENYAVEYEMMERALKCIRNGRDVVFDTVCLSESKRRQILRSVLEERCMRICVYFRPPLKDILKQNQMREEPIPEEQIRKLYQAQKKPVLEEGFDKIIIY